MTIDLINGKDSQSAKNELFLLIMHLVMRLIIGTRLAVHKVSLFGEWLLDWLSEMPKISTVIIRIVIVSLGYT